MVRAASTSSRGPLVVSALVAFAGVVVALWLCQLSVPHAWQITAVLCAVAIVGFIAGEYAQTPIPEAAQPWNVHAIWLVPSVLLTGPRQFLPLLLLSLAATLWPSSRQALRSRLPVAANTVVGCAVLYGVSRITGRWQWGLAVGLPVLLVLAGAMAVLGPRWTGVATRSGFVREWHWTAIEVCSACTACLVTVAMSDQPVVGLTAIPPMVLAVFALRWPELTSRARTDDKTGLPNAGRWEDLSRRALQTSMLTGRPVSLLIIDIDHFKAVNDTYGHLAGDGILISVAECIRTALGPGDLVGRFGGEEFVVTTVDLHESASLALAERIRRRIASTSHQVVTREGVAVVAAPVTCTIGVASSETLGHEHTTLLRRADAALSTGKRSGRDQVVRATAVGRPALPSAGADHPRLTQLSHPGGIVPVQLTPQQHPVGSRSVNRAGLPARPASRPAPLVTRNSETGALGALPVQRSRVTTTRPIPRSHETEA
ncbi:diguanylate cyclase (GGDEF)-like protein [Nakamurella sp. UYEF19]|uniref:GGDEF domain-containing protein n=1 Tax=Nakamurella sp. UYEF19 TaxID=1756392 RepID=UPI003393416F